MHYPHPTPSKKESFISGVCWVAILLFATDVVAQAVSENPAPKPESKHWAFQKPVRPEIPRPKLAKWVHNPIDAFILAKLEANQLAPSSSADRLTLLRRVTFDLTGLPPTPEAILTFLKDENVDAYERLVDRLLASPQYGERWAQHWLDTVRYAESNGFEGDAERPSSWRYRDYVIDAFNRDKPFDQFLKEQIAGDEIAQGKDARSHAHLWVATGLHRCGPVHVVSGNLDREENRQEQLTEMVQGVSAAFLGLTVQCARCHDHKFDPISQADYYRLQAYFASTFPKEKDYSTPEERSTFQKQLLDTMVKVSSFKAQIAELDAPFRKKAREVKQAGLSIEARTALETPSNKRSPEQTKLVRAAEPALKVAWNDILAVMTAEDRSRRAKLRAQQHALEAELPMPPSQAWSVADNGKAIPTYVLKRGDVKRRQAVVEAGFPSVLVTEKESNRPEIASFLLGGIASWKHRGTRHDLAQWLTQPEHPLTARVFVNRLWQHHFGQGIVATPNDFGLRGARPTHPELLDYLATELIRNGWRVKPLHRLMVLSNTYRQVSTIDRSNPALKLDPDNKLLWRMNRRRLEAETLRDAILATAGTLNRELGGPMIRVPLEKEVYDLIFTEDEPDGLWPVTKDTRQHSRRSIYLFAKRNVRLPLLEVFDQPDRSTPCAVRGKSTFAPQALILMNGPFAREQSRALAANLLRTIGNDRNTLIDGIYRRALSRLPTPEEQAIGSAFLSEQAELIRDRLHLRLRVTMPENLPEGSDLAEAVALADFALAILNTNEFLYVP